MIDPSESESSEEASDVGPPGGGPEGRTIDPSESDSSSSSSDESYEAKNDQAWVVSEGVAETEGRGRGERT